LTQHESLQMFPFVQVIKRVSYCHNTYDIWELKKTLKHRLHRRMGISIIYICTETWL